MTDYLPPIALLNKALSHPVGQIDDGGSVDIEVDVLKQLIACLAKAYSLDEADYAAVFRAGETGWQGYTGVADHFQRVGYIAGAQHMSRNFDAVWYLQTYPDVAQQIADGAYSDAQTHYRQRGQYEWRAPNAAAVPVVRAWRLVLGELAPA